MFETLRDAWDDYRLSRVDASTDPLYRRLPLSRQLDIRYNELVAQGNPSPEAPPEGATSFERQQHWIEHVVHRQEVLGRDELGRRLLGLQRDLGRMHALRIVQRIEEGQADAAARLDASGMRFRG